MTESSSLYVNLPSPSTYSRMGGVSALISASDSSLSIAWKGVMPDSSGNENHPLPVICVKRADGTAHGHLHAGFQLEEGLFIITRPVIYPGRHFNHVLPRGRRDCERLCRRFDFLMGNCEKSVLPRPPAQPLRLF